jgi:hypothetical protein
MPARYTTLPPSLQHLIQTGVKGKSIYARKKTKANDTEIAHKRFVSHPAKQILIAQDNMSHFCVAEGKKEMRWWYSNTEPKTKEVWKGKNVWWAEKPILDATPNYQRVDPIHAQDPAPILQMCVLQTKTQDACIKWLRLSVLWSRLALFVSELYARQYSR